MIIGFGTDCFAVLFFLRLVWLVYSHNDVWDSDGPPGHGHRQRPASD